MSDDYTPTTEELRQKYATGATWQHQGFSSAAVEFDRWLAAHDAEKDKRIAELEVRVAAHEKLGLAAIFLADTFDSDAEPDVEIRKIRDEWLADRLREVAYELVVETEPDLSEDFLRGFDAGADAVRAALREKADERSPRRTGSPMTTYEATVEKAARAVEESWGNPTWDGKTLRPIDRTIARAALEAAGYSELLEENGRLLAKQPSCDGGCYYEGGPE